MKIDKVFIIHWIPSRLNLVKATLSRIFHSVPRFCSSYILFFFLPFSSCLSPCISHFTRETTVREPIFPRNVRIPTRGRNREGNFIGALFYKYLSSFESIGDRVLSSLFSCLRRPFLLPALVHGLFPSSRPNSQACICSCKSFIRFVRGFASITAMGDLNRLFHLGFISPPILPRVLPLFPFCSSLLAFRDDALEIFVNSVCLFVKLAIFVKAESILSHFCQSYLM